MILLDRPCPKCSSKGLHEVFPSAAERGKPYLSCVICGLIIESTVQEPKPDKRHKKRQAVGS